MVLMLATQLFNSQEVKNKSSHLLKTLKRRTLPSEVGFACLTVGLRSKIIMSHFPGTKRIFIAKLTSIWS